MYLLLQMTLFWFFHVTAMFTKLKWPLRSRRMALAGRCKYFHASCVLVSSVMPALPVAVVLGTSYGFGTFTFPPLFCFPTNREVTFYSVILPITVLMAIGSSLLLFTLWTIRQHYSLKESYSAGQLILTSSEKKLFIILCYYVVFGTISLTAFSMSARNVEAYAAELGQYFLCTATRTTEDCQHYQDVAETHTPLELAMTAYLLLGLFPAVNLMYAVRVPRWVLVFPQPFVAKKTVGWADARQTKAVAILPVHRDFNVQLQNDVTVFVNTGTETQVQ